MKEFAVIRIPLTTELEIFNLDKEIQKRLGTKYVTLKGETITVTNDFLIILVPVKEV